MCAHRFNKNNKISLPLITLSLKSENVFTATSLDWFYYNNVPCRQCYVYRLKKCKTLWHILLINYLYYTDWCKDIEQFVHRLNPSANNFIRKSGDCTNYCPIKFNHAHSWPNYKNVIVQVFLWSFYNTSILQFNLDQLKSL